MQSTKPISVEKVDEAFRAMNYDPERPVLSGTHNNIATVRLNKELNHNQIAELKSKIKDQFGSEPNVSTVSPQVGRDLAKNGLYALIIASVFIIIYVWVRFEFLQGLTAVLALIHDAFFIVTVFSLLHIEVDILFISAILTIIGYSINDTIVTFDRVRENIKMSRKRLYTIEEFGDIVNLSIRETLTRSLNTVITVLIPVVLLLIFGSESIRTFTIALFVGLLCGVYSSICIACPLWAVLKVNYLKRRKRRRTVSTQPQN
ncbi:protein-export membrane protein SecD [Sporolactobacillus inulinus]|uniref:Protein translocase subunit SecF n=1 Tax=Sporolactobacillus inulinus TaxID=2078 RepID=A0A4Y1ZGR0_9BACL|nr:protein-export membrane protein SecD [Sporolactobacillus inulinus]